jgi:hypothetical protein
MTEEPADAWVGSSTSIERMTEMTAASWVTEGTTGVMAEVDLPATMIQDGTRSASM